MGVIVCRITLFHEQPIVKETINIENFALGSLIVASSNNKHAQILVDGQELPNVSWHSSWAPPQVPSRPSWVTIDLGRQQPIKRIEIIFSIAAYEGIYDIWAPPNSINIEAGNHPDKMQLVEIVGILDH